MIKYTNFKLLLIYNIIIYLYIVFVQSFNININIYYITLYMWLKYIIISRYIINIKSSVFTLGLLYTSSQHKLSKH